MGIAKNNKPQRMTIILITIVLLNIMLFLIQLFGLNPSGNSFISAFELMFMILLSISGTGISILNLVKKTNIAISIICLILSIILLVISLVTFILFGTLVVIFDVIKMFIEPFLSWD